VIDVFRRSEVLGSSPPPVICRGPAEELPAAWDDGCTDYLKDPWTPGELHFRAGKILAALESQRTWHGISVSPRNLTFADISVPISAQEYRILSILIRQQGTAVPREALYYAIWGKTGGSSRVVDMHISKLRAKMASLQRDIPKDHRMEITSMYGEGYVILSTAAGDLS
jgi:two-component system, OmpR family, response regulator ResD